MSKHLQWPDKDTVEVLDYDVDWSADLVDDEVITSSAWQVPTGITKQSDTFSDTSTKIWLSGGTNNATHTFTNTIHTDGGRTLKRTVTLRVVTR